MVTGPGQGVEAFWEGLTQDPGIGPFVIKDWDPSAWIPRREARRLDLFSQYARVAAHEALQMAGDHQTDPERSGACVGTGIGGMKSFEYLVEAVNHSPRPRPSPLAIPMMMSNAARGRHIHQVRISGTGHHPDPGLRGRAPRPSATPCARFNGDTSI